MLADIKLKKLLENISVVVSNVIYTINDINRLNTFGVIICKLLIIIFHRYKTFL